jgi:hypothetical protein
MARMRVTAALLFVAKLAAADPERAAPEPSHSNAEFSFTWSAPDPCPPKTEVLARAERLIGHPVTGAPPGNAVELSATVERQADETWQLEVLSAGPGGESRRMVSASSCDELGDAMALWIALSVDPDYAARGGPGPSRVVNPGGAREPAMPPRPVPEPPSPPPAPTRPPVPARAAGIAPTPLAAPWLVRGEVGGAVWLERLPGVAPGGVVYGALAHERRVLALELGLFPPERAVRQSVSADLSLATLTGTLGYAWFDGVLTPYAGLELDLLHGVGRQIEHPASGNVWLLGFDAGLRLSSVVRGSLRLFVDGRASVLAERARFHVEPDTELFRPSRVGAQFGLGAELGLR